MSQGVLVAGTHSGVGKTTVTLGIMGFLARFHRVVPFKVGPDYLDPGYHRMACGTMGYNLDLFLLGRKNLEELFRSRVSPGNVAVVEGVMGLFDGLGERSVGSSAQVAKILGLPVILVVDASGMAGSAAALVRGFRDFDRGVDLAAIFLNRVRSDHHAQLLKRCIERETGLPVVGFLPQDPELVFPERHLGLVPAGEARAEEKMSRLLSSFERFFDGERLVRMMREVRPLSCWHPPRPKTVRIGLAYDEAFHFYYRSSLETLEREGAELVPFSPLQDEALPERIGGLYLGGGFPEVFAESLAENHTLRKLIREAVERGMPVYAECGGLMYLARELHLRGERFPMVGAFPFTVEMTDRLQRFGYAQALVVEENMLASLGTVFRGHEFHYSRLLSGNGRATYLVRKPYRKTSWSCGFVTKNTLATYLHLDFFAFPQVARRFVEACRAFTAKEVS